MMLPAWTSVRPAAGGRGIRRGIRMAAVLLAVGSASCTTEAHRTVDPHPVASYRTAYSGPRDALAIGKFANGSPYMRGIFSDGVDRLGNQARTILKTHLSQSGRFTLVDRENLEEASRESGITGTPQQLKGATFLASGEVTEFGRRTTGDRQLFGLAGRGKKQVAYAKVSLNVVDVRTSQVVVSVQGAGEYELNDRELLGFGTGSGYDSTLNGKVLDLAVAEAVNRLVESLENGEWGSGAGAAGG